MVLVEEGRHDRGSAHLLSREELKVVHVWLRGSALEEDCSERPTLYFMQEKVPPEGLPLAM